MANSEEVEAVLLDPIPGTADAQNNNTCCQVIVENDAPSCCDDEYHRKLAICSILCGISCIGIKALIYSVKAKMTQDTTRKAQLSRQAKKLGIMSIVIWLVILGLTPILLALVSYLLTLMD